MEIIDELKNIKPEKETVITIGVFDGVHLGHQSLINHLNGIARRNDLMSIVITFKSHPETILRNGNQVIWLDDLETRIDKITKLGVDRVVALNFSSELSNLDALEFIRMLKDYLKLRILVIGPDFALGKGRKGDIDFIKTLSVKLGFTVEVMPPLIINGEVVSSSLIRQMLAQGNLVKSTALLGQYFSIKGEVVTGEKRGKTLGFPTANLKIRPEQSLLPDGVYLTLTYLNNQELPSVTNIGRCPTFAGENRVVEIHVIGKEIELLGKRLKVDFVDKIRDEKCFGDEDQLKAQINIDIGHAKRMLSTIKRKDINLNS
jgi:riboflavin kinase/FMN adenylyltransferase